MPLKFLNFPYLVQEKIMENMEFSEIFQASLCSKRMKQSVIRARVAIPKTWFVVKEDSRLVGIKPDTSYPAKMLIKMVEKPKIKKRKMIDVKIGEGCEVSAKIRAKYSNYEGHYCQLEVLQIDKTMTKALHDHVKSIFKPTQSFDLQMAASKISDDLPIFENVKDIFIPGATSVLEVEVLERFLEKYPKLHSLNLQPIINGLLTDTSKIFENERVYSRNPGQIGKNLLLNFSGKSLELSNVIISETDIVDIIRKWVTNEGYQDLETLILRMASAIINTNRVFDALPETEMFNPAIRSPNFYYDNKIIHTASFNIELDANSVCRDVIRPIDGKRASIRIECHQLAFVVWN
ncbi:hypothetical protein CRE_09695 [Caenorhabditis remanei]|uniref:F-box domain-containing protein n=1 Tax=Caenorhabditis remanei TaxID=31234 RepID=E3MX26_CAERE|nr:hypothetical protein CRE_09695 [Caenorhabditis remanei]